MVGGCWLGEEEVLPGGEGFLAAEGGVLPGGGGGWLDGGPA